MSEFQPTEFAAAFSDFLEFVSANAPKKDRKKALLADRVEQFLEADASSLEIVREEPLARDLPNVQVAIDELRDSWGMSYEAVGYQTEHEFGEYGMAEVLNRNAYRPVREGAVR